MSFTCFAKKNVPIQLVDGDHKRQKNMCHRIISLRLNAVHGLHDNALVKRMSNETVQFERQSEKLILMFLTRFFFFFTFYQMSAIHVRFL